METNNILQKIIDAKDAATHKEEIKEWGVEILLIEPSRKVVMDLQKKYIKINENDSNAQPGGDIKKVKLLDGSDANMYSMALMYEMVHDLEGKKVFNSAGHAAEIIGSKATRVSVRLGKLCADLIKLPGEKDMKGIEGNSEETPSSPSNTD